MFEPWVYAKSVFAAAVREWGRLTERFGFATAIILAPLFFLVSGVLVWTALGSYYVAWFIFFTAAMLLLVIAPYRVWVDQRDQIENLKAKQDRRIEIQFDKSDPSYFSRTHIGSNLQDEVIFVSVLPIASPSGAYIRECRGYLDRVWQEGPDGEWLPTEMNRPQRLMWASEGSGDSEKSDLDSEEGRPLNVFFVSKKDRRIQPWIPKPLNKHREVFADRTKSYRFDIRIRSHGESESARIALKVQLGDQWDDIRVERSRD